MNAELFMKHQFANAKVIAAAVVNLMMFTLFLVRNEI